MMRRLLSASAIFCLSAPAQAATPPQPIQPVQSLFFSLSERDAIERAKAEFLENAKIETEADLLNQLQGIKQTSKKTVEEPQETTYPQFYLETVMYRKPGDWSVWVRDISASSKITSEQPEKPDAALKVVGISQEEATLEWAPRNWSYVARAYRYGTPNVTLDHERKRAIFTLRVNQTLRSHRMQVEEGVLPPVTITPETLPPEQKPANNLRDELLDVMNPLPEDVLPSPPGPTEEKTPGKPPTVLEMYQQLEPKSSNL